MMYHVLDFFFFKQKTAYEMRISDWSSDVCPSDLDVRERLGRRYGESMQATLIETGNLGLMEYDCGDRELGLAELRRAEAGLHKHFGADHVEIGRASCRERVCQYV